MISGLEARIAANQDVTNISYVVSLDFSTLISRTGSSQGASEAVRRVASALDSHANVHVFRQFILLEQNGSPLHPDLTTILEDAVEFSGATNSRYALLAIPAEVRGVAPAPFRLWLAMLWARAARKLSLAPGAPAPSWNDVLDLLKDLVSTPTPTADAELCALRGDVARIEAEWSDASAEGGAITLVAQDFVGYSSRTTWGSRVVGVGVRDALEAAVEVVLKVHDPQPLDLYDLFRLRRSIQQRVDDFELQVRRSLTVESAVRLIPAGADGSLGNDGILAAINGEGGARVARMLHHHAAVSGFYPVTVVSSGQSVEPLLAQAEQCLAASKAAAHLGVEVEVVAAPCNWCHSQSASDSDSYISKQRRLFSNCVRTTEPFEV